MKSSWRRSEVKYGSNAVPHPSTACCKALQGGGEGEERVSGREEEMYMYIDCMHSRTCQAKLGFIPTLA